MEMRYDLMRPHQIRDAIALNRPVLLPLGVMEYHGEHLAVGTDMLAVSRAFDRLEAEDHDAVVILPAFAYGAASHAVAAPQGNGTLHIDAEVLVPFAKALFAALLSTGFRNIHGVIHHQTEDFAQGMPTDLAFRLAARQAIFAEMEHRRGQGWWGADAMRAYYEDGGTDPFDWIRIHPLLPQGAASRYPSDHAGRGETGLMLALAAETVAVERIAENTTWYTETAARATAAEGETGVTLILSHLRQILGV